jgi:hypothetical protein
MATGAEIAAAMIREGAMPQAAFHAAARRTGEAFLDIARECSARSAARRRAAKAAKAAQVTKAHPWQHGFYDRRTRDRTSLAD